LNFLRRHRILADCSLWTLTILEGVCKGFLEVVARATEARRDRRILHALDDRMLRDMGISRSDIERVSSAGHAGPAKDQKRRPETQ
jgi:uncharacterized protein YjiS (DUF1127 family)